MRTHAILPFMLLGLLGACDFNVLVVEVESDEVCVAGLSAELPANAKGSVTVTLLHDEGVEPEGQPGAAFNLDMPEGWEVREVTFLGVDVSPREGIDDLHFIDTVHLDMTGIDPDLDLPPVMLIDIDLTNLPYNTASNGTTFWESQSTVNLVDYLDADELEFGLTMTGAMPDREWALNMDVCFTFVAEYRENL